MNVLPSGTSVSFDTTKDLSLFKRWTRPADAVFQASAKRGVRYSDHPLYLHVLLYFGLFIFLPIVFINDGQFPISLCVLPSEIFHKIIKKAFHLSFEAFILFRNIDYVALLYLYIFYLRRIYLLHMEGIFGVILYIFG